ncbi:MAG: high-potential iron-sulfur protein [Polyangiales bacterium]
MSTLIDRRQLLRRLVTTSAVATVGVVAAACDNFKAKPAALSCTDTAGLGPDDVKARTEALGYVDKAPDATKKCGGCVQYVAPPAAGGCGTCKLVKGPINPDGWCKVFAPKPA